MLRQAGVTLTAIFSPEHGFRGVLDQPNVANTMDSATGLPIFSLYGENRAPTAEMLDGIDVMVADLQDIGARTYTYISTVLEAMKAAGAHGIGVIVADRPNPIGGRLVQGPVLDPTYSSFVGMLPIPQRHGMTLAELAALGRDLLEIDVNLNVVPASGWIRDMWWDATGLPWVRPSPSMPDLESATHYPGTVWFEATNLSVGRGTPVAFQVLGAPWLDAVGLAAALQGHPGVAVTDTVVRPVDPPDGKYGGIAIPALRLRVLDRDRYDSSRLGLAILAAVRARHPDSLVVRAASLDRLSGDPRVRAVAEGRAEWEEVADGWRSGLDAFVRLREPYLLYR